MTSLQQFHFLQAYIIAELYIYFFTLAASILRESLIRTFKKERSHSEVKCSPKQNCFALEKFSQQSQNFIFMTRVELVIGIVGFILENRTVPFRVLDFFQKKTYSERDSYEKMQLMYSAILASQTMGGGVEVVTEVKIVTTYK